MADSSAHNLMDELADEFLNRKLAGESPSISDYCQRYPHLKGQIRTLFETLDLLESAKNPFPRPPERQSHPKTIAEYQIQRVIGRGGMGLVYEAVHSSLGRRVALKVMSRRISEDSNAIARFQREARAVAKLHHTNIVPLFEVGEDDGRWFLAMQLISGMSLDQLIAERIEVGSDARDPWSDQIGLSSEELISGQYELSSASETSRISDSALSRRHYRWIARIGLQAAEALAYAHQRGVIHRDIKPSNLLLGDSGVVWLTDFGLAKTEDDALTQTGEFVGTLRYMAPEQLRGNFDARTDVYALGATLYELLALRPAFTASDRLHVLDAIHHSSPPRLRELNPHIPRDLETIVMKAMDRELGARYPTAQALADDLLRFVNDEPIRARRLGPLERLMRWQRRNKGLAAALLLTTLLLLSLIGVLSWTSIRQAELRQLSDEARQQMQRNLYLAQMNVAGQALVQGFGTETIKARLSDWQTGDGDQDLRNWEWYYLHAMAHRESFTSNPLGNGFCWACDHSPDGTRIVNTVNAWGVQVRDSEQGTVLIDRYLGSARSVAWSPDGEKVAVGRFDDICSILDAKTLETISELKIPHGHETVCLSWHPDSNLLAEVSKGQSIEHGRQIRVHDIKTGILMWSIDTDIVGNWLSWHPDGSRLACADYWVTTIWKLDEGQPQLESETQGRMPAWSPDGTKLAVARGNELWDAISEKQLASSQGVFAWAPDSKRLAVGSGDGVIRIHDIETSARRVLLGHASAISSISWSQDGQFLASTGLKDETVRTWNVDTPDAVQEIIVDDGPHAIRLSSDGLRLASAVSYGDGINLADINGVPITKLQHADCGGIRAINADGSLVAFVTRDLKFRIWNTNDGTVAKIATAELGNRFMASMQWNADGRLAAATQAGDIIIWNQSGVETLRINTAHDGDTTDINWHPHASQLATAGTDGCIKVWNTETGTVVGQWQPLKGMPGELHFSSDGSQLAGTYAGEIVIWDAATGQTRMKFNEVRQRFHSLDWSPDDSRIVASSPAAVTIWDVDSGKLALRIDAPPGVQNVGWSADGMHIVAGGDRAVTIYDATRGYEMAP